MSASDFFRKLQPLFESEDSKLKARFEKDADLADKASKHPGFVKGAQDAYKGISTEFKNKAEKLATAGPKGKLPEGTEFFRKYSDIIAEAEDSSSNFFHNPELSDEEQLDAPPEEVNIDEADDLAESGSRLDRLIDDTETLIKKRRKEGAKLGANDPLMVKLQRLVDQRTAMAQKKAE